MYVFREEICGLSEEEKKAIEYYKDYAEILNNELILYGHIKTLKVDYKKLKTLVNLIQKQDTEINKLKNVIDRMAEVIEECRQNDCIETTDDLDMSEIAGVEKIKEYFMKDDK